MRDEAHGDHVADVTVGAVEGDAKRIGGQFVVVQSISVHISQKNCGFEDFGFCFVYGISEVSNLQMTRTTSKAKQHNHTHHMQNIHHLMDRKTRQMLK